MEERLQGDKRFVLGRISGNSWNVKNLVGYKMLVLKMKKNIQTIKIILFFHLVNEKRFRYTLIFELAYFVLNNL